MKIPGFTGIRLKIFSEVQDKIVDGSGGWEDLITPYCLKDFLS
jgi:hypothetical protein